jgi:hypothetical protein
LVQGSGRCCPACFSPAPLCESITAPCAPSGAVVHRLSA